MILQASNITKAYGSLTVVHDVSIAIDQGEVVSIVGPSGAGKSTLLHIIGTLDRPDSGSVTIGGEDLFTKRDKDLARFRNSKLGFIFQFHHLLPEFTALENVCIPAYIAGISTALAQQRASELLDLLKLSHRLHHKPSQLSGGEQQRVAVARALMNKPAIIMADEPSGNLDSDTARELHRLFFDLRDSLGQTFVIVTHNEELARMADRTISMRDGVVITHAMSV
jgi:lipoprotein-releasing system ATP-binding protein